MPTYYLTIFSENCMKTKKFWLRGCASLVPPLRSAAVDGEDTLSRNALDGVSTLGENFQCRELKSGTLDLFPTGINILLRDFVLFSHNSVEFYKMLLHLGKTPIRSVTRKIQICIPYIQEKDVFILFSNKLLLLYSF